MEEILEVLTQFGGGKGVDGDNAVRFILPAIFWTVLASVAFKLWQRSRDRRDIVVGAAALFGLARELFLLVAQYGSWRGFIDHASIHHFYPPIEHAISLMVYVLMSYAFLRYFISSGELARAFLSGGSFLTLCAYLITAPSWRSLSEAEPSLRFSSFSGDWIFHSIGALALFAAILSLAFARTRNSNIPKAIFLPFLFCFMDDFLMLFNLASNDTYKAIFAPIRHNLHIWAIPLLLNVYWTEYYNRAEEKIRRMNAELEARVQERTAQLENANMELKSYSYTVSHDLRTPLLQIIGYSQLLLEDCGQKLDRQCKEYVGNILTGGKRMAEFIDSMLAFHQITKGEMRKERIDFSELAKAVTAEFRLTDSYRRVLFRIDEGVEAMGEGRLMRMVMENLLGNAWKYTSTREEAVIEFGAEEQGGKPVYFIRDNGVGFDMVQADKLFRPFHRLHPDKDFEGHGIGLATVRRVIEKHGGKVWAKGAVDNGATFYFTLE